MAQIFGPQGKWEWVPGRPFVQTSNRQIVYYTILSIHHILRNLIILITWILTSNRMWSVLKKYYFASISQFFAFLSYTCCLTKQKHYFSFDILNILKCWSKIIRREEANSNSSFIDVLLATNSVSVYRFTLLLYSESFVSETCGCCLRVPHRCLVQKIQLRRTTDFNWQIFL